MRLFLVLLATAVCSLFISAESVSAAVTVVSNYPSNQSKNVSTSTSIGVKYSSSIDKTKLKVDSIRVFGSVSGFHSGAVILSSDGKTVIFKPSVVFASGELVSVRYGAFATTNVKENAPAFTLQFTIAGTLKKQDSVDYHSDDPILEGSLRRKRGGNKSPHVNPLYFPTLNVLNYNNPAEGNLYVANLQFEQYQAGAYRMILDKKGNIIFAQSAGPSFVQDFKPGPNHTFSYFDAATERFYIMNSSYEVTDSIGAVNGYQTDGHELRYTKEGGYIILAINYATVDMREISGGDSSVTVLENVIQEFDREKNLIFEWRSLDHFKITDAIGENLLWPVIDFCHANSLEFDSDGNILLSCRHMDEITKINRDNGEIIWRLGGANNQFTFVNDSFAFSHQHDFRLTSKGTYTMFDNGNLRPSHSTYSRAVEYSIDQVNKTVTQVWEYRHDPDVYGLAMGSVQRLSNGNTLVGWGACDNIAVTEVNTLNKPVFELIMGDQNYTYRAYKYTKEELNSGVNEMPISSQQTILTSLANPVFENTEIKFTPETDGYYRIVLYDQLGKQSKEIFAGELSPGEHYLPLDVSGLPNGTYHLRAIGANMHVDQKILIVK